MGKWGNGGSGGYAMWRFGICRCESCYTIRAFDKKRLQISRCGIIVRDPALIFQSSFDLAATARPWMGAYLVSEED